jgi:hypothetical protein
MEGEEPQAPLVEDHGATGHAREPAALGRGVREQNAGERSVNEQNAN